LIVATRGSIAQSVNRSINRLVAGVMEMAPLRRQGVVFRLRQEHQHGASAGLGLDLERMSDETLR
jgi:hypothetical protein